MQLPCCAPRPTRASALPLKPTLRMTCEPRAIVGGVGATSGVVPWVITSGLYTLSLPFGPRIVASTNTPSVSPFCQVQPSPSTHGVARPRALSGWSGTVTVQFVESAASAWVWAKLNASPAASTASEPARPARPGGLMGGIPVTGTATSAATAGVEPDADGQGDGGADAGALVAWSPSGAGALVAASPSGAGALVVAPESAAGPVVLVSAAAEAQLTADCWAVVALPPFEATMMMPRVRPSATGMARGTAMRAARLFLRRRDADLCPLSIQSTSMWKSPVKLPVHHRRPGPTARSANEKDSVHVRHF